jgi:hypothetical protein
LTVNGARHGTTETPGSARHVFADVGADADDVGAIADLGEGGLGDATAHL